MRTDIGEEVKPGRSLQELTTPRPFGMPSPEIFDRELLAIEAQLRLSVPKDLRKRIGVARNLLVYGTFCYDFVTLAAFWSLTCVEMALWEKFIELHPEPMALAKKKRQMKIAVRELPGNVRFGWRPLGMPDFDGSLQALAVWAVREALVPADGSLKAIVKLRNALAHPGELSLVFSPPMSVDLFEKAVEIVNHLWPLDVPPADGTLISPSG